MKFEWAAVDIRAGRVVGKSGRIERWMIGYDSTAHHGEYDCWALVSTTDGMILPRKTKKQLAAQLNESSELPAELLPPHPHKAR